MKKLLLFIMMIVCVGLQAQQIEDLRRKAEDGDDEAQYILGQFYNRGLEGAITINEKEALHWLRKSAEQGNPKAQRLIGRYYELGSVGLIKDEQTAAQWYEKAVPSLKYLAEKGDAEAQWHLGICYEYGDGIEQS